MPKGAKERTALTKYTAQGSVNYIGQQKTKLSAEVLDDPALVEKYDQQRKVFTKQMQDKLDEYEAENRLPDEELSAIMSPLSRHK